MPTGYTHKVQSNEIRDFRDFALQCARAFSALSHVPLDAEIPIFEPYPYYTKTLQERKAELRRLQDLTQEEAERKALKVYEHASSVFAELAGERDLHKARYEAMLEKVLHWSPPTPEHVSLKTFMIEQLHKSIEYDCGVSHLAPPTFLGGEKWRTAEIKRVQQDIDYYESRYAEELERVASQNLWVKQLQDSLND